MDRFRELEIFVTVVEAGSFVGAAEKLRISKSAASRILRDLEERLGGRLLQRTTRKLALTEAGRAYYERCKHLISEIEEADDAVARLSSQTIGLLKINAPLSFGTSHLAPLWGEFLQRYPQVKLDIALIDRMVDLVSEGFDLAVRITSRPQDSSLIARKLASSRIVLCASPAYLQNHGTPQTLEDLVAHDFIGYSYSASGDSIPLASGDLHREVKVRPRLRVNNGDTCRAAALDGLGIIFQPTFIVGEDLKSGALMEILQEWHTGEVGVHAVYPVRRHLSGKVRAMVDFLAEEFRTASWNSLES